MMVVVVFTLFYGTKFFYFLLLIDTLSETVSSFT